MIAVDKKGRPAHTRKQPPPFKCLPFPQPLWNPPSPTHTPRTPMRERNKTQKNCYNFKPHYSSSINNNNNKNSEIIHANPSNIKTQNFLSLSLYLSLQINKIDLNRVRENWVWERERSRVDFFFFLVVGVKWWVGLGYGK